MAIRLIVTDTQPQHITRPPLPGGYSGDDLQYKDTIRSGWFTMLPRLHRDFQGKYILDQVLQLVWNAALSGQGPRPLSQWRINVFSVAEYWGVTVTYGRWSGDWTVRVITNAEGCTN